MREKSKKSDKNPASRSCRYSVFSYQLSVKGSSRSSCSMRSNHIEQVLTRILMLKKQEREILRGVRWIIQGGQMNFVKRKNDFFILAGVIIGIFI